MGFWDSLKANQPAPKPVEATRPNIVGAPLPEEGTPLRRARYMVVGVWAYDHVAHKRLDEVDRSASGRVDLDEGRSASVGEEIELTREEAANVSEVFALSLVL